MILRSSASIAVEQSGVATFADYGLFCSRRRRMLRTAVRPKLAQGEALGGLKRLWTKPERGDVRPVGPQNIIRYVPRASPWAILGRTCGANSQAATGRSSKLLHFIAIHLRCHIIAVFSPR